MNANRPDKPSTRRGATRPHGRDVEAWQKATVLVADDDPDMRLYVKRCLRALLHGNAVILEAIDGVEALHRVRRGDVDLLISDVVMPRTDGLELCRIVRQDPSLGHVSILLVTGELSIREIKSCTREFGPVQVICKPFNADQLCAKVAGLLEGAAHLHHNPGPKREPGSEPGPDHKREPDPEPEGGP